MRTHGENFAACLVSRWHDRGPRLRSRGEYVEGLLLGFADGRSGRVSDLSETKRSLEFEMGFVDGFSAGRLVAQTEGRTLPPSA